MNLAGRGWRARLLEPRVVVEGNGSKSLANHRGGLTLMAAQELHGVDEMGMQGAGPSHPRGFQATLHAHHATTTTTTMMMRLMMATHPHVHTVELLPTRRPTHTHTLIVVAAQVLIPHYHAHAHVHVHVELRHNSCLTVMGGGGGETMRQRWRRRRRSRSIRLRCRR